MMQNFSLKLRDGVNLWGEVFDRGSSTWLIFVHGIGEHSGRHSYLKNELGHSFNLLSFDLRGHGQSEGTPGDILDFDFYRQDLEEVILHARKTFGMENYILFGHSMGALIISSLMQNFEEKSHYPSLVLLNSPPVSVGGPLGLLVQRIPEIVFSSLAKFPVAPKLPGMIDLHYLSHDKNVIEAYKTDPLVQKQLSSRLLLGLVATSKKVFSKPLHIKCPCYLSFGTSDQIVNVRAALEYTSLIDKTIKVKAFSEAYHEIHNEIDLYRKPYFQFISSTIEKHLVGSVQEDTPIS